MGVEEQPTQSEYVGQSLLPPLQLSLAYRLHWVCQDATSAPLFLQGKQSMAPLGFLQFLCLPVPHTHQGKGSGISRSMHELQRSII